MYVWLTAAGFFIAWLVCRFVLGKEGFIHILLLTAVSIAFVQFIHERRAAMK